MLQEGEIKGDIEGADISKIETLVAKHIPALDEWKLFIYSYLIAA